MKSSCLFRVISAALLLCLKPSTSLKRLHLGHCVISVNIYEIRHSYVQSKDEHTDIRILYKSYSLQDTEISESCCLLRHLLRFYIESVFKHHEATSSLLRRRTSRLSNSFLSIKGKLKHCVSMEAISGFINMETWVQ
uniref:Interleukin-20 n=1 Tax=Chelydra serpentina TaxID=8475 RepID=A0A8C3XIA5_CHESE